MAREETRRAPAAPRKKLQQQLADMWGDLRRTWAFILELDRRQHEALVAYARDLWAGLTRR